MQVARSWTIRVWSPASTVVGQLAKEGVRILATHVIRQGEDPLCGSRAPDLFQHVVDGSLPHENRTQTRVNAVLQHPVKMPVHRLLVAELNSVANVPLGK